MTAEMACLEDLYDHRQTTVRFSRLCTNKCFATKLASQVGETSGCSLLSPIFPPSNSSCSHHFYHHFGTAGIRVNLHVFLQNAYSVVAFRRSFFGFGRDCEDLTGHHQAHACTGDGMHCPYFNRQWGWGRSSSWRERTKAWIRC